MKEELIARLSTVTPEEEELLKGQRLNKKLYTGIGDFIADRSRLLGCDKLIDIRPHTRFVEFPSHKHNYVEIMYMAKGKTEHCIDEKINIVLEAGDLLFLNQHVHHSIATCGTDDVGINFMIRPEFFDVAFSMLSEKSVLKDFLADTLTQDTGRAEYLHFRVADILPVQNLIENLVWSLINKDQDRRNLNAVTAGLLMLELLNHTDRLEHHDRLQQENTIVMNALNYIETNYRTASLSELARNENLSESQLSRYIKKQTGSGFKELLQEKKISRAVMLLTQTDLPVADIISSVGYDNSSYFFRMFRERFDMTPRDYRAKYKIN